MANLTIISDKDNVATATCDIEAGTVIVYKQGKEELTIQVTVNIPLGHKIAVRGVKKGEPVIKYGENIGIATCNIAKGDHVHIHNVESRRGRGDLGGKHE